MWFFLSLKKLIKWTTKGHLSGMITEKYAKFNLRKLRDDFPSLKERINLRLTPPSEDSYFTTLLNVI